MAEPIDLGRWFEVDRDSYVVRDDVRELVELRLHNLITEPPPFAPGEVDLLLCRNVTIYFNRATTKALIGRFHATLSDGGYLFLGHSETLWQMSDAFTLVPLGDAFVYRRDDGPEPRVTLPDRRTEAGDAPILLQERRGRSERRRRSNADGMPGLTSSSDAGPAGSARPSHPGLTLPPGQALPGGWPPAGSQPMTLPTGQPSRALPAPARREPTSPDATVAGRRELGAAAAGRDRSTGAGTADANSTTADFLIKARSALTGGRYAEAVVAAGRAAKADPMLVDPHLIAGEALVNLGRDGDAVKELRQALYVQPDCAPALLLLAGALDRLGEPAAAGRAYRSAAATVGDLPPNKVAGFFGGRDAAELVALCIRLAMQAERAARTKGREKR